MLSCYRHYSNLHYMLSYNPLSYDLLSYNMLSYNMLSYNLESNNVRRGVGIFIPNGGRACKVFKLQQTQFVTICYRLSLILSLLIHINLIIDTIYYLLSLILSVLIHINIIYIIFYSFSCSIEITCNDL